MRILMFLLLLTAIATDTFAQSVKPSRIMQGVITNNAGKALGNARVYVRETDMSYLPDKQGRYFISLPEKDYKIEFSAPNYLKQELIISLIRDTVINLVMEMPFGGIALDDVDVFGSSSNKVKNPKSGFNAIDGSTIERLPAVLGEKDVMRSIQLLPGISATSEGSTEMNVRGGSNDQNLVMLDNVPLYSSSHLFGMFSSFNPLIVKEASIYTGAFPAVYGGKISSVTDVVTKTASMDSLSGSAELGITSTKAMLEIPLIKGKSSLLLAGRRTFIDLLQSLDRSGETEYFNFYDLNAIWTYRYSEKSTLKLSAYQEGDGVRLVNQGQKIREDSFGKKQQAVSFTWKNFTGSKFNNEIGFQYNLYRSRLLENRPEMSNGYSYRHEFTSQVKDLGASYRLGYRPWNFMSISAGANYTNHQLMPAHIAGHEDQVPFSIYSLPNIQINEFSAFAEMGLSYKNSNLSLAVRNNHFFSKPTAYNSIEPRISFSQQVGNTLSLKAAYARMGQPMQRLVNPGLGLPFDIMYPADEFIKPQSADIYSAGLSKDLEIGGNRYTVSAEGYFKKMDNIISMKDGYDTRSVILHTSADAIFKTENVHDMLVMGKGKAIGADLWWRRRREDSAVG